jgi:hypothetical protein
MIETIEEENRALREEFKVLEDDCLFFKEKYREV